MSVRGTGQAFDIRIGAQMYRLRSDDDYLGQFGGVFEPHMCTLFERLIKPHFRVLDIGANVGCTSLLFGQLAAHVDSFEPSPSTFEWLRENVTASGHTNIALHNVGLGAHDETLTLTFNPAARSGGFVSNQVQPKTGHVTETITIKNGDSYLGDRDVDFIKIDVEGFERYVIEGLKNIIDRNEPVVVLELNHWCLNAFQRTSVPDFFDFLLERFPILYAIEGDDYVDLRNSDNRYKVMGAHILRLKYCNLVGAFRNEQLDGLIGQQLVEIQKKYNKLLNEFNAVFVERDTMTKERDAARSERDALAEERDAARKERDALLSSRSWRLTQPIRTLITRMRS